MKPQIITKQFEDYVNNHCCYLWGASGQKVIDTSFGDILRMENSDKYNACKVINHVKNLIDDGIDLSKALFFDCSGMVIKGLDDHKLFYGDATADKLYNLGTPIKLNQVQEGDLAFKGTDKNKGHVGWVGKNNSVIEAKGRDRGVVCVSDVSSWDYVCHYTWFDELVLNRKLKVGAKGKDVENLQKALRSHGFECKVDGDFGAKTKAAVTAFQKAAKLSVLTYGTVAQKTAVALGFTWIKQ